jgi:hypothetical protein
MGERTKRRVRLGVRQNGRRVRLRSLQQRFNASPERQPVSARNRAVATAAGHTPSHSAFQSACANLPYSSFRSRRCPHPSAKRITPCSGLSRRMGCHDGVREDGSEQPHRAGVSSHGCRAHEPKPRTFAVFVLVAVLASATACIRPRYPLSNGCAIASRDLVVAGSRRSATSPETRLLLHELFQASKAPWRPISHPASAPFRGNSSTPNPLTAPTTSKICARTYAPCTDLSPVRLRD